MPYIFIPIFHLTCPITWNPFEFFVPKILLQTFRVPKLLDGVKMLSRVHQRHTQQTGRQTDGRTDRRTDGQTDGVLVITLLTRQHNAT